MRNRGYVSIEGAVQNKLLLKWVKNRCMELSGKNYQPKEDNNNVSMGELNYDNKDGSMIKDP